MDDKTEPCTCDSCTENRETLLEHGAMAAGVMGAAAIQNKLDIIPGPGPERGLADAADRAAAEQSRTAPIQRKRHKAQGLDELPTASEDLKECCLEAREDLLPYTTRLRNLLHTHPTLTRPWHIAPPDTPAANIHLAYRHLEDARMRLGKAVQALDGGTSVYPR